MPRPKIPTIVLVGRTNVGKSTLFNRLIEQQKALISDIAGTTRDRKEGECLWRGKVIKIVDTGGLDTKFSDEIEQDTQMQARLAISKADIVLFVVNLKQGPLPQEHELALQLAKSKKPVLVVGNKAESMSVITSANNPEWRLAGLPAPLPVSALRGNGIGDLLDIIYDDLEKLGKKPIVPEEIHANHVAIIGKPNVGKSSLINAIIGEERFITGPVSHTTREPNDTLVEVGDKSYVLIDTAGMRKKGKVRKSGGLEAAGVERTRRILKKADVAILVVEANEKIDSQTRTLAGMLKKQHVGVIVVANKWDLVEDKETNTMNEYRKYFAGALPFLRWAPVIFVSALTKQRVKKIFGIIDEVQKSRTTQIPEDELEKFWRIAIRKHLPSRHKGPAHPKVLGMKQVGITPPTFELIIKAKQIDVIHSSYIRFLENQLREKFGLIGTPVIINVRAAQAVSK